MTTAEHEAGVLSAADSKPFVAAAGAPPPVDARLKESARLPWGSTRV